MHPGLHGRASELGAIQQGLSAVRSGQSSAFALVGEPGIGKTRLTVEIAERAASAGFTICWGRAWEAGGAPPYWPWRLLFESMPSVTPEGPLAQLWGRRVGEAAVDPDQARFELFDASTSAIRGAASAG